MKEQELINAAERAMKKSYAPYSHFNVGAALLCKDGKLYLGANVENSSFSLCCCAERNAFFRAVNDGEREFEAIAIVGGKNHSIEKLCPPCGACRELMAQLMPDSYRSVEIMMDVEKNKVMTLGELTPEWWL